MPLGSLKQNTIETLFTLGDLPKAKGSRSGAYSPHTLEMEGKQSRAALWGWNICPHHLSCPSLPLWVSILTGNSECASLAADLRIQQLNPIKVLSLWPPPLPTSTYGIKLLRIQEVHLGNSDLHWIECQMYRAGRKMALILGMFPFLQKWYCLVIPSCADQLQNLWECCRRASHPP